MGKLGLVRSANTPVVFSVCLLTIIIGILTNSEADIKGLEVTEWHGKTTRNVSHQFQKEWTPLPYMDRNVPVPHVSELPALGQKSTDTRAFRKHKIKNPGTYNSNELHKALVLLPGRNLVDLKESSGKNGRPAESTSAFRKIYRMSGKAWRKPNRNFTNRKGKLKNRLYRLDKNKKYRQHEQLLYSTEKLEQKHKNWKDKNLKANKSFHKNFKYKEGNENDKINANNRWRKHNIRNISVRDLSPMYWTSLNRNVPGSQNEFRESIPSGIHQGQFVTGFYDNILKRNGQPFNPNLFQNSYPTHASAYSNFAHNLRPYQDNVKAEERYQYPNFMKNLAFENTTKNSFLENNLLHLKNNQTTKSHNFASEMTSNSLSHNKLYSSDRQSTEKFHFGMRVKDGIENEKINHNNTLFYDVKKELPMLEFRRNGEMTRFDKYSRVVPNNASINSDGSFRLLGKNGMSMRNDSTFLRDFSNLQDQSNNLKSSLGEINVPNLRYENFNGPKESGRKEETSPSAHSLRKINPININEKSPSVQSFAEFLKNLTRNRKKTQSILYKNPEVENFAVPQIKSNWTSGSRGNEQVFGVLSNEGDKHSIDARNLKENSENRENSVDNTQSPSTKTKWMWGLGILGLAVVCSVLMAIYQLTVKYAFKKNSTQSNYLALSDEESVGFSLAESEDRTKMYETISEEISLLRNLLKMTISRCKIYTDTDLTSIYASNQHRKRLQNAMAGIIT